MTRYLLTPAARGDMLELAEFIREDRPQAAAKVLRELREAMRRLAKSPEIGHLREDLADEPLRFWPVYSYLIIYRPHTRPIQILRVLHGSPDIRAVVEGGA